MCTLPGTRRRGIPQRFPRHQQHYRSRIWPRDQPQGSELEAGRRLETQRTRSSYRQPPLAATAAARPPALTFPPLITFFTASAIRLEWNSRLARGGAAGQPCCHPACHPPALRPATGTYLRCRSMLEAESSMAVGLAMFRPTAWAKGCRAPCQDGNHSEGPSSPTPSPAAPAPR